MDGDILGLQTQIVCAVVVIKHHVQSAPQIKVSVSDDRTGKDRIQDRKVEQSNHVRILDFDILSWQRLP
jgi:hypothetical protein